ncbi:MAG: phytanoyl-CoA dioxygenase family protein [Acidobacteriota bacterium]
MNLPVHRQQYEADGFLQVDDFCCGADLERLERELERYDREVVPKLPEEDIVYEIDSSSGARTGIRNLWRMEQYSSYLREFAHQGRILELVGSLVKGQPVLMGVELFAKPARVGSAVPYHQDNGYFNLTPPDALTWWLALDDSTLDNGCVFYARGTHRQGLLPHRASGVPGNSWGLAERPDPALLNEVPGVLRRGSAILHHCCLIHRSERNRSERSRRGLLMVYKAAHCQIHKAGMEQYQTNLKS